jgi:leader peptidase (prepilin peptidase)/N-methyltransferase
MILDLYLYTYLTVIVFVFGACIGSFLNVCIYRIPLDQSVVSPPSHCFACDARIAWYDNIPLFSYLILRGACRRCKASYSARYFLVELLTGCLFLLVWLRYGGSSERILFDPRIPVYWMVISGLILGTFVDFDHLIIPDRVTIGGMISGVIFSLIVPSLHGVDQRWLAAAWSLVGLTAGFGILLLVSKLGRAIFKQDAMGFGDVKLLGAIGAYMGYQSVFFVILISSFTGAAVGLTLVLVKSKGWQSRIPYGPYLALGAVLWILCGDLLWDWYVDLLSGGVPQDQRDLL